VHISITIPLYKCTIQSNLNHCTAISSHSSFIDVKYLLLLHTPMVNKWPCVIILKTQVLTVRDKERATKRWLISDEIRWLKYGVKTAKRKNCGKMTSSAAIASEHDKNRNSSRLVSVDAITLIYAKLHQSAAVTRYIQMLDSPKNGLVTPTITPLNFKNTFFL